MDYSRAQVARPSRLFRLATETGSPTASAETLGFFFSERLPEVSAFRAEASFRAVRTSASRIGFRVVVWAKRAGEPLRSPWHVMVFVVCPVVVAIDDFDRSDDDNGR